MHVGPEILKKEKYGTKIDCWAMGVVVYTIIGGCPPFYAKTNQAIFQQILNAEYDFEDEEMWGHITVRLWRLWSIQLLLGIGEKNCTNMLNSSLCLTLFFLVYRMTVET